MCISHVLGRIQYAGRMSFELRVLAVLSSNEQLCSVLTVSCREQRELSVSCIVFQHGPRPQKRKTTHRNPTCPQGFHSPRDRFLLPPYSSWTVLSLSSLVSLLYSTLSCGFSGFGRVLEIGHALIIRLLSLYHPLWSLCTDPISSTLTQVEIYSLSLQSNFVLIKRRTQTSICLFLNQ